MKNKRRSNIQTFIFIFVISVLYIFPVNLHAYSDDVSVFPADWNFQMLVPNRVGELVNWPEADKVIPRKATFEVIDLETGLSFNVQRRAGSKHADVQPLTFQDTKIMKEIYDGKWKWHRRAILVHKDGRLLAASMHGMPHGRGALKNGFPGHFCIHFKDSTTHQTRFLDPTHQVMLHKAAGLMDEYINKADPYILTDLFIMALNQQDEELYEMVVRDKGDGGASYWNNKMKDITAISRISTFDFNNQLGLTENIPVRVRVYWRDKGKETLELNFTVSRASYYEPWKVEVD